MRYFLFILLFFIGCNNQNEKKVYIDDVINSNEIPQQITKKPKIIKIKDLVFYENNNSITYNFNKSKILIFLDNNKYSKLQLKELNKTNIKYYIINNEKLEQHFKIKEYPTILVVDKNSTKKYEGFIPYEILKYEIKD